jgi:hypothetical protein
MRHRVPTHADSSYASGNARHTDRIFSTIAGPTSTRLLLRSYAASAAAWSAAKSIFFMPSMAFMAL